MQALNPSWNLGKVKIRKFDGFQGGEATLVFLDLVVTEKIGFVGDHTRLSVALTRARDGLIVIGDCSSMNKGLQGRKSRSLASRPS